MKKPTLILIFSLLLGLTLSLSLPAAAGGGSAADPLLSASWVDAYIERQFAPLEEELRQLREEYLAAHGVSIVLTIDSPRVRVNGAEQVLDVAPRIVTDAAGGGYTMVPVRFVAESIGINVEWLNETRQVKFYDQSQTMLLTVGSTAAQINGRGYTLPCAPIIDNSLSEGRTLVHVRFVAEAFGCSLDWEPKDSRTETVYISK